MSVIQNAGVHNFVTSCRGASRITKRPSSMNITGPYVQAYGGVLGIFLMGEVPL